MDLHQTRALVKRMQQGDQEAFGRLYDEFADRIYKFIRLKISDSIGAEDLLQEVFVKAWQGCKKLDTSDLNFSAWLYKVAGNTVNDYFRKVYRRPQTEALEAADNFASTETATKLAEDSFDARDIKIALKKLPPQYKQVIELRFFQEFSVEETAQALNKSSVSIRVLQFRATKKLEQLFKKYGRKD